MTQPVHARLKLPALRRACRAGQVPLLYTGGKERLCIDLWHKESMTSE